jgi:DNA polymerase-3 subunit epsilon
VTAFSDCRFVVVDVETTGVSALNGDRVTEVAAVVVEQGRIDDAFQSLVNPGRPIPARITALTGISDEMVAGAPDFRDIAEALALTLADRTFVAHNAVFDWGFLSMEFRRAERPEALVGSPVCTVRLARRVLAHLPRRNLDAVAWHYGIPIDGRHRALGDARATAQVLQALLRDAERRDIHTLGALQDWIASRTGAAKKRRSAMPRWVDDSGLGPGA